MADSDFEQQLASDLIDALRSGDEDRKRTIRLLITELKYATIEAGAKLDEARVQAVLHKQARQRRDSILQYEKGGRDDLADSERRELAIIEAYMPDQMSEEAIERAAREVILDVGATGPGDIGRVMAPLMAKLAGRADGKQVSQTVRRLLSG